MNVGRQWPQLPQLLRQARLCRPTSTIGFTECKSSAAQQLSGNALFPPKPTSKVAPAKQNAFGERHRHMETNNEDRRGSFKSLVRHHYLLVRRQLFFFPSYLSLRHVALTPYPLCRLYTYHFPYNMIWLFYLAYIIEVSQLYYSPRPLFQHLHAHTCQTIQYKRAQLSASPRQLSTIYMTKQHPLFDRGQCLCANTQAWDGLVPFA